MKILVLGAAGYTGAPIAKYLSDKGHEVVAVDSYYKVKLMKKHCITPLVESGDMEDDFAGRPITSINIDVTEPDNLYNVIAAYNPDTIIHLAQQPSAPYSMMGEDQGIGTIINNVTGNMRLIYAVLQHNPDIHIIKLGTMGAMGTPNIAIPEGWIDIAYKGRTDRMLFPRKPHSIYHLSKVNDSDALAFAARVWNLRVTDLNQGFVYGTYENNRFTYDGVFGTVLNRFMVQAVADVPLTVYGAGGQTRGALHIKDTLRCIELAAESPAKRGEFRVFNQFTEQFSINYLAKMVADVGQDMGIKVKVDHLDNPRSEMEDHFYEAEHDALLELGLDPVLLTPDLLANMITYVEQHASKIDVDQIMPRIKWAS